MSLCINCCVRHSRRRSSSGEGGRGDTGQQQQQQQQLAQPSSFVSQHQQQQLCLLEGCWLLQSARHLHAYDLAMRDTTDAKFKLEHIFIPGKAKSTLRRLATEPVEEWAIHYDMPVTGVIETRFRIGDAVDDLTPSRKRSNTVYSRPHCNALVIHYTLKNDVTIFVIREVDPVDPDTLVTTFKAKGAVATLTSKRLPSDVGQQPSDNS